MNPCLKVFLIEKNPVVCGAAGVEHTCATPCLRAEESMHMCHGTLQNENRGDEEEKNR